ncbi:MAG: MFS transporter, partial [candidate division NC10 bacterium]
MRGVERKAVAAWTLYDFANSAFVAVVPATVYSKYYALIVVGNERGEGDFWWGLAVTVSMAIVARASPPLGAIADHAGVRKRFLFFLTYASVAATARMATVEKGDVRWGWLLAVVGIVGFEGAIVYYTAYLPDLAPPARRGRLSAYGFAVG